MRQGESNLLDYLLRRAKLRTALKEAQDAQEELTHRLGMLSQSNALLIEKEQQDAIEIRKLRETNTNLFKACNAKQLQIEKLEQRIGDLEGHWQESNERKE